MTDGLEMHMNKLNGEPLVFLLFRVVIPLPIPIPILWSPLCPFLKPIGNFMAMYLWTKEVKRSGFYSQCLLLRHVYLYIRCHICLYGISRQAGNARHIRMRCIDCSTGHTFKMLLMKICGAYKLYTLDTLQRRYYCNRQQQRHRRQQ